MKPICPRCRNEIPPENVNVAGNLAHCRDCNEAFTLAGDDLVRVERPANAKSVLIREPERLAIAFPRGGFKGAGCFFTIFALFWNAITWTFVVVTLASLCAGVTGHIMPGPAAPSGKAAVTAEAPEEDEAAPPAKQAQQGRGASVAANAAGAGFGLFGLLFMIPFVLIGLVTAGIALYCVFGETSLAMDRERGVLQRRLFRWKHEKSFLLSDITAVRIQEAYRQNESPVYGVGIVLRDRKMPLVFASNLAEDEKAWLVGEVHAFWKELTKQST